MGEAEGYLRRAEEAVSIYRETGDAAGFADALSELGVAQMTAGKFDAARATLVEARDRNLAVEDRQKAGECTVALGFVAALSGRPDEARGHLEDALATFTRLGEPFWSAFAERWIGWLDQQDGEEASAERRYRSSLAIARTHDIALVVAMDLYAFADLALARGRVRAVAAPGGSIPDAPRPDRRCAVPGDGRSRRCAREGPRCGRCGDGGRRLRGRPDDGSRTMPSPTRWATQPCSPYGLIVRHRRPALPAPSTALSAAFSPSGSTVGREEPRAVS